MFTGLIEAIGTLREKREGRGSTRIAVESDLPLQSMADGDSVAVNGVCLTVVNRSGNRFHADVIRETLEHTTLGRLRTGEKVNLERALALGDRLGGHLVQGHVDGTGRIREVVRQGDDYRLRISLPRELARYVAWKGSVTVDGVSLTVSAVEGDRFEVALIPETRGKTGLGKLGRGDEVNLEVDLMARYLARLLESTDNHR
ncbi:MAG: riboflavin synthase [Acidobacteria bacterium]|uniref:Riboflavin synthase n=1 Tax=Candidatus Polarisedimenticola svalbardensis TaxID=2886004 RepID=A0A8J6XS87_9BACT|nr:riboflavin synthase [Candidatus Polarisedimenticola svalbardensis]